jgi:hypothetical protein
MHIHTYRETSMWMYCIRTMVLIHAYMHTMHRGKHRLVSSTVHTHTYIHTYIHTYAQGNIDVDVLHKDNGSPERVREAVASLFADIGAQDLIANLGMMFLCVYVCIPFLAF